MRRNPDDPKSFLCVAESLGNSTQDVKYLRNSRSQSYSEEMVRSSMRQLPVCITHPHDNKEDKQCKDEPPQTTLPEVTYYKRLKSCGQLQSVLVTLAIQEGDVIQLWRLLARKDVDINEVDGIGMQPIHYACIYGELEILKILLQEGADIDTPTKKGDYPLDIAVCEGNFEVAQYLISRGARIKSVVNGMLDKDNRRRTYAGPSQTKRKDFPKVPYEI